MPVVLTVAVVVSGTDLPNVGDESALPIAADPRHPQRALHLETLTIIASSR